MKAGFELEPVQPHFDKVVLRCVGESEERGEEVKAQVGKGRQNGAVYP